MNSANSTVLTKEAPSLALKHSKSIHRPAIVVVNDRNKLIDVLS
jgi:hypothetical protein